MFCIPNCRNCNLSSYDCNEEASHIAVGINLKKLSARIKIENYFEPVTES